MLDLEHSLGSALRAARLRKHYSQEALAERVDVTLTHLQHIESGHRKPSIEVYFALVEALDFSTDDFLCGQVVDALEQERHMIMLMLAKCNQQQLHVLRATAQALLDTSEAQP